MIKSSILIVIFKGNHSAAIFLFKSRCLWLAASLSLGCVQVQAFFSIYALLLLVSEVIPTYDSCQNYVSFSIYIFIPTLDFFFPLCFILLHYTNLSPGNCQCNNKSPLILFPAPHTPSLHKFNLSHIDLYTAYEERFLKDPVLFLVSSTRHL